MSKTLIIGSLGMLVGFGIAQYRRKPSTAVSNNTPSLSAYQMRQKLISDAIGDADTKSVQIFLKMTDLEIQYVYHFLYTYKGKLENAPTNFKTAIPLIGQKYNIFT
jgi:hypothetical protein